MTAIIPQLLSLTRKLREGLTLEHTLQLIADTAAQIVPAPRCSVRLLDRSREFLLASVRSGAPLHENPNTPFKIGEGLQGWVVEHGLVLRTGDAESDPRFVAKPGMTTRLGAFLGVPLMSGPQCMGVVSLVHPGQDYFTREHADLVQLITAICEPYLRLLRVERLARIDPVTRALNHTGLELALPDDELKPGLSLAAFRLDNLSALANALGTLAVNTHLVTITEAIKNLAPDFHHLVRYNDNTFLLVMPSTPLVAAEQRTEIIRSAVEAIRVVEAPDNTPSTLSSAAIEILPQESRESLIQRALARLG